MIDNPIPWLTYLLALIVGGGLAAFTTTGLWWTVQRLPQAKHPFRLYTTSTVVRLGIVLAAFYGVLRSLDAIHLLVALTGFSLTRLLAINPTASAAEIESHER